MTGNPVLVEVTRGGLVESQHRGAYVAMRASGEILVKGGDTEAAIFPRSAIKALQALPLLESGAAEQFGFTDEEIALACASHAAEPRHVRTARSMLAKAGIPESALECGPQVPRNKTGMAELFGSGHSPQPIHNNCSGKHAGMLALAKHLGADLEGYTSIDHPVQKLVAQTLTELCDEPAATAPCAIDGCSLPTWAFSLNGLARAFAQLTSPENLPDKRQEAIGRIVAAVRAHPFMVSGTGGWCTRVMTAIPRAFVKIGAEGVYCGCVPDCGVGFAMKCDDGGSRAVEVMMASVLTLVGAWTQQEREALEGFVRYRLYNRRNIEIGELRCVLPGV